MTESTSAVELAVLRYTAESASIACCRSVKRRVPMRFTASNVPTRCDRLNCVSPRRPRFVVMTTTPFVAREP